MRISMKLLSIKCIMMLLTCAVQELSRLLIGRRLIALQILNHNQADTYSLILKLFTKVLDLSVSPTDQKTLVSIRFIFQTIMRRFCVKLAHYRPRITLELEQRQLDPSYECHASFYRELLSYYPIQTRRYT